MYGAALPTWLLLYNCWAALAFMLPEYKRNLALRAHLDTTSTGAPRLGFGLGFGLGLGRQGCNRVHDLVA